jgi:hypothetical protein
MATFSIFFPTGTFSTFATWAFGPLPCCRTRSGLMHGLLSGRRFSGYRGTLLVTFRVSSRQPLCRGAFAFTPRWTCRTLIAPTPKIILTAPLVAWATIISGWPCTTFITIAKGPFLPSPVGTR